MCFSNRQFDTKLSVKPTSHLELQQVLLFCLNYLYVSGKWLNLFLDRNKDGIEWKSNQRISERLEKLREHFKKNYESGFLQAKYKEIKGDSIFCIVVV